MKKFKEESGRMLEHNMIIFIVVFILTAVLLTVLLGDDGLIAQYKQGRLDIQILKTIEESEIYQGIKNFFFKDKEEGKDEVELGDNKPQSEFQIIDQSLVNSLEDDSNNIDLQTMILEYNIISGDTITLPLPDVFVTDQLGTLANADYNLKVDWGDGETAEIISGNDINKSHFYSRTGTYEIKLTGTASCIGSYEGNFNNIIDMTRLTKVKQWGTLGIKSLYLANAENLTQIATPTRNSFVNLRSVNLSENRKLEQIPELLFANATKVEDFTNGFYGCESLKEIPNNLFRNCPEVQSYEGAFGECIELESVPEKLFINASKVKNFDKTFFMCTRLASIPENIFEKATLAESFSSTFAKCENLKQIPEGLFKNNTQVKSFAYTFIADRSIKEIPTTLFENNKEVTTFESTFEDCSSIEKVPITLFTNNTKVKSFKRTFNYCIGIKSELPKLWLWVQNNAEYKGDPEGLGCYFKCDNAKNISEVPTYWKEL